MLKSLVLDGLSYYACYIFRIDFLCFTCIFSSFQMFLNGPVHCLIKTYLQWASVVVASLFLLLSSTRNIAFFECLSARILCCCPHWERVVVLIPSLNWMILYNVYSVHLLVVSFLQRTQNSLFFVMYNLGWFFCFDHSYNSELLTAQ